MGTQQDHIPDVRRIGSGDADRDFLVIPENNDLFVRTGKQVIEACELQIGIHAWMDELRTLLGAVAHWAAKQDRWVSACYAWPRGAKVGLFFVPRSGRFDFDLADLLAELNRDLVHRYNVGMIEIHQVPADELDRFLISDRAPRLFGDASGTHQTVAT